MASFDDAMTGEGGQAISGAATAAMGAATGNPIALMAGIAGIATSIFGGTEQAKVQKEEAGVSAEIAGYEEQINKQRQIQAQIMYSRQSLENLRNTQKTVAMNKAAAVAGGAQFGSGAAGGVGGAETSGALNQLNLSQDYTIGQNIFGLTSSIDADKIKLAKLGGEAATYGGIASIGQGLTSGAMSLGRLSGGFGAQG
jgi:hypothetical protein